MTAAGFAKTIPISLGSALVRASVAVPACPVPNAIRATRITRHGCHPALATMTMPRVTNWSREFEDPIPLPKGKTLITLRDAAQYITKLPKAEHNAFEWQAAMEALILVAEHEGPTMFARVGVMRALNRHVEQVFNPDRKDMHWGRRKLARDQ
jgi:hypothetical protein